ncbi:MAG: hypothetical protein ABUK01_13280 [Leptospirales bacterium]
MAINIALVGLGIIGGSFLKTLLEHKKPGFEIIAVAEVGYTPGLVRAKEQEIPIHTLEEISRMGDSLDIIFDLTGNVKVRQEIRKILASENNNHTTVVPEIVALFFWYALEDRPLPDIHENKGYTS